MMEKAKAALLMRRIGIAPPFCGRQHYPTRKRADFHLVLRHEKADGNAKTGVRRLGSSLVATGASLRYPLGGSSVERALSLAQYREGFETVCFQTASREKGVCKA